MDMTIKLRQDLYDQPLASKKELEACEHLSTIVLPHNSSAIVVLKSHVSVLEKLGIDCPPYIVTREDIGTVKYQDRIAELSKTLASNISLDHGDDLAWADRSYIERLFVVWLQNNVTHSERSPLPTTGCNFDADLHTLQDGEFDFKKYTFVRLSDSGKFEDTRRYSSPSIPFRDL
jgi:hypothetical protein